MCNFHLSCSGYIRLCNITENAPWLIFFGNMIVNGPFRENRVIEGTAFTDCLQSLNDLNIPELWHSCANSISGVIFSCFYDQRWSGWSVRAVTWAPCRRRGQHCSRDGKTWPVCWKVNSKDSFHEREMTVSPLLCVYCPPMWKKTQLEAAQCKHRSGLVWMRTDAVAGDVLLQVPVCQHGLSSQSHKATRPMGHHAAEPCTSVTSQFLLCIHSELVAAAFLSGPPKSRLASFACVSEPIYGSCLQTWSRS